MVEAASAHGIDPALLTAIAWVERALAPRAGLPHASADPARSLDGAARHLGLQLRAFGDLELALAAFIAGPAAVVRHGGVPPYTWSRSYVERVMACYRGLTDPGASIRSAPATRPSPPDGARPPA